MWNFFSVFSSSPFVYLLLSCSTSPHTLQPPTLSSHEAAEEVSVVRVAVKTSPERRKNSKHDPSPITSCPNVSWLRNSKLIPGLIGTKRLRSKTTKRLTLSATRQQIISKRPHRHGDLHRRQPELRHHRHLHTRPKVQLFCIMVSQLFLLRILAPKRHEIAKFFFVFRPASNDSPSR